MRISPRLSNQLILTTSLFALAVTGCSKGGPSSGANAIGSGTHVETFSPSQAVATTETVTPRARILFMVDNSPSTENYQSSIATAFTNFGQKYLGNTNIDLSVAAITSDTYLADPNVDLDPTSTNSGNFYYGYTPCYSRLVPGIHDGILPLIADGLSNAFNAGTCDLTSQAYSDIQASGNRTLRPILSTRPTDGSVASSDYLAKLASDWNVNAQPGTLGSNSERGFQSVHQFLKDNEERPECAKIPLTDPTCLFPHYNLNQEVVPPVNAVVFLSDEHDQSFSDFGFLSSPIDHRAPVIQPEADASVYSNALPLVQAAKSRFDGFFRSLHQANDGSADPNYSVFAITNLNCNPNNGFSCGIQSNTQKRDANEQWGVEYAMLVDAYAGNSSSASASNGRPVQSADPSNSWASYSANFDINQAGQYATFFDSIANRIIQAAKTIPANSFTVSAPINYPGKVSATLVLSNGTQIPLNSSWITVSLPSTVLISSQYQSLIPSGDTGAQVQISYQ